MAKIVRGSGKAKVVVGYAELPLPVVVVGNEGDSKEYRLNRAGKHLGACLGAVETQGDDPRKG